MKNCTFATWIFAWCKFVLRACVFLCAILLFASCTPKDASSAGADGTGASTGATGADSTSGAVPELIFSDVEFVRVQNNHVTLKAKADSLEFFSEENTSYGRNVSFELFSKNEGFEASGKCGLLFADNKNDIYMLLNGVEITNYAKAVQLEANNLRWNNATEQLVADKNESVKVIRKPEHDRSSWLVAEGTGFAASMLRMEYTFANSLSGTIDTGD